MPFHLAIPVRDLNQTRKFYTQILGCEEGRSDIEWVDLNFYGHQLVLHIDLEKVSKVNPNTNEVDGHSVPIPHFGVILHWEDWHQLKEKLIASNIEFGIEPYIRFEGLPGEQATMFFYDPSGNALEFKSFKDLNQLFAK